MESSMMAQVMSNSGLTRVNDRENLTILGQLGL